MGQAKRRKEKGLMPEPSPKTRKTARMKPDPRDYMMGMGDVLGMVAGLMMHGRHSGKNFALRSEMARMNRESVEGRGNER